MYYVVCYVFLIFLVYSFLGYLVEVFFCSRIEKKLVLNRGFCLGPYLPIYGVCCVIMSAFLVRYQKDPFTLFVMGAFVCTAIEYLTSYLLEKIFKARWWDYSERSFNIEGRVCLSNALLFGIGGLCCVYLINPLLTQLLTKISPPVLMTLATILLIIFISDVIITIITMWQVKIASKKFARRDMTSEISRLVRGEVIKNAALIRHMLNAFPKIDMKDRKDPLAQVKSYLEGKHNKRIGKKKDLDK